MQEIMFCKGVRLIYLSINFCMSVHKNKNKYKFAAEIKKICLPKFSFFGYPDISGQLHHYGRNFNPKVIHL